MTMTTTGVPTIRFEVPIFVECCCKKKVYAAYGTTIQNAPSDAIQKLHIADAYESYMVEHANRYCAAWASVDRCDGYLEAIAKFGGIRGRSKHIQYITLENLKLDEWEILLQRLYCSRTRRIEELELIEGCDLSCKGARFLGSVLGNAKPSDDDGTTPPKLELSKRMGQPIHFDIKGLKILNPQGSMKWVSGLVQNQTIIRLHLEYVPALYSAFQFIENSPRLKSVEIIAKEERDEGSDDSDEEETDDNDEENDQDEEHKESSKEEIIRNVNRHEPMDLETLSIRSSQVLCSQEFPLRFSKFIGNVLSRANQLQEAKLDVYLLEESEHFQALCSPLAENKGPKYLRLHSVDLRVAGTMLASSLVGNNKIEKLELIIDRFGINLELEQELVNTLGKMPRLQSWDIKVRRQDDLGSWMGGQRFRESVKQWEKWISSQIRSNWNLQEIDPPFPLSNEIKEMLKFNRWRKLFYNHDRMPCGIWSLALSQIKTVNLMFRVIQEVPSLFQQVANETSQEGDTKNHHTANHQLPSFVVPHHPNCPACHKKKKYQETFIE